MQFLAYLGATYLAISIASIALVLGALTMEINRRKRSAMTPKQLERQRDEAMYQAYLRELKAEAFIADLFAEPHEPKHPSDSNPYDISRFN